MFQGMERECNLTITHSLILPWCMSVQALGGWVLRPFLQDTIKFWPLTAAMTGTLFTAPVTIARVLIQVRQPTGQENLVGRQSRDHNSLPLRQ